MGPERDRRRRHSRSRRTTRPRRTPRRGRRRTTRDDYESGSQHRHCQDDPSQLWITHFTPPGDRLHRHGVPRPAAVVPPKASLYKDLRHFDTFSPERFKYYGLSAGDAPNRRERNATEAAGCRTGPSWEVATTAKRGRPASASRDDVLQAVAEQYVTGRRVDVTVVARRLGVSRATIYRWFGSREGLIGEVVAIELER